MWVFSRHGFVSIVAHREEADTFLLRHRSEEHADRTASIIGCGMGQVLGDNCADYRWRITATREQMLTLLRALGDNIDYDNFKNAAGREHGPKGPYVTLLHRIWSASVAALGIGKGYYSKLSHCIEEDPYEHPDPRDHRGG